MSLGEIMGKAYEPQGVEDAIYHTWLESGYFNPDNLPGNRVETFSLMLPPPNVTGTLHMGHATMLAIEDAMVRFARLRGKKTLWLPGTDHAAIATQSKVEKMIKEKEGTSRHDLGREPFLDRVRAFAQESHDTIVNQCKKMGSSLDWSREAYTLDDARNHAVNTAFKRMYDDGLIYRGHRVVNWDPVGQTTISDDEIVYKEGEATLYTFTYSKDFPIAISTTRPETKIGDTAVAVHPSDERYVQYIGKTFDVDFAGAKISLKVIADESVEKDFGTGALGVTPAHSSIDAEIAERHALPMLQVIDEHARMMSSGSMVDGMTTLEAREAVVAWLKAQGLLQKEEKITQNLSTAERTGAVIEPLPKLQWFVAVNKAFERDGKMVTLKSLMQDAVRSKSINILPDRFEKTYFHWIDNLRDWCISRQIWFGHRIPVWYKDFIDEQGRKTPAYNKFVGIAPPEGEGWIQDEDTLDTWFSSGLWTFSTLGWPNLQAEDLKTYHPTTVLETGYDILFFWVARMILMTTYLTGEIPFKTVYLHGLVRDEQGRKMSKSLGNIIDPLTMIEKYGADATRLSLVIGGSPGNDMKLSEEKIAGFRNFTNKLWNISRFVIGGVSSVRHVASVTPKTLADKWILSRFAEVVEKVTKMQESYDLSLAGEILRDFTWGDFADWYLEVAKIEGEKEEMLLFILERLLIMWHPFMPFVTEEIYKQWNSGLIMVASWPDGASLAKYRDEDAEKEFYAVQQVVKELRTFKNEHKKSFKEIVDVIFIGNDQRYSTPSGGYISGDYPRWTKLDLEQKRDLISLIQGLTGTSISVYKESNIENFEPSRDYMHIVIPYTVRIRTLDEISALNKAKKDLEKFIQILSAKLDNADFLARAPENVITQEKQKLADAQAKLDALTREIAQL